MVSLWAEPGGGGCVCAEGNGKEGPGSGAPKASAVLGEELTLGEEVSLVLPTTHSKDPMDLIRVGRVEKQRLPGALGGSGSHRVGKGSWHRPAHTQSCQPCPGPGHADPCAHPGASQEGQLGGCTTEDLPRPGPFGCWPCSLPQPGGKWGGEVGSDESRPLALPCLCPEAGG